MTIGGGGGLASTTQGGIDAPVATCTFFVAVSMHDTTSVSVPVSLCVSVFFRPTLINILL